MGDAGRVATTPKDTSPDLDLIRKAGDKALQKLMQEFDLKLKDPKPKPQDKPNRPQK